MAQTQWIIAEEFPIKRNEAADLASRCSRDLQKLTIKRFQWQYLVENLSTLAEYLSNHIRVDDREKNFASLSDKTQHPKIDSTHLPYPQDPYFCVIARGLIQLHPSHLQNVRKGIRAYLVNFLLRYSEDFGGIWVAYDPQIVHYDPFGFTNLASRLGIITFSIELRCLVFRPRIQSTLVGCITKVRDTHIALLVDGIFSACIKRQQLNTFYNLDEETYRSLKDGLVVLVTGSLMEFQVEKCVHDEAGAAMSIEGSLAVHHRVFNN